MKQTFDAAQAAAAGAVGLNPGESFSVAVNELFDVPAPGGTVVHSATSSDPLVQVSAPSTTVTVTAVSAGSAAVRVTARVTGASAAVPRTRRDEAAVEHAVTATPGLSRTHGRCTPGMAGRGQSRQDVVGALGDLGDGGGSEAVAGRRRLELLLPRRWPRTRQRIAESSPSAERKSPA